VRRSFGKETHTQEVCNAGSEGRGCHVNEEPSSKIYVYLHDASVRFGNAASVFTLHTMAFDSTRLMKSNFVNRGHFPRLAAISSCCSLCSRASWAPHGRWLSSHMSKGRPST
jgi:hypothetical protein